MCRYKNVGVAGYAEAFIPVQSDSQTSEWYSYFENDVLVIRIQPCSTLSKMSANGSMAFFTSWTVFVWAPASRRRERGRRWRL